MWILHDVYRPELFVAEITRKDSIVINVVSFNIMNDFIAMIKKLLFLDDVKSEPRTKRGVVSEQV